MWLHGSRHNSGAGVSCWPSRRRPGAAAVAASSAAANTRRRFCRLMDECRVYLEKSPRWGHKKTTSAKVWCRSGVCARPVAPRWYEPPSRVVGKRGSVVGVAELTGSLADPQRFCEGAPSGQMLLFLQRGQLRRWRGRCYQLHRNGTTSVLYSL